MKDHVIFFVEEEDFAVGGTKFGAESFCELNGGESSADDDYSDWLHVCSCELRPKEKAAAELPDSMG
jgi:hypothetical protein